MKYIYKVIDQEKELFFTSLKKVTDYLHLQGLNWTSGAIIRSDLKIGNNAEYFIFRESITVTKIELN